MDWASLITGAIAGFAGGYTIKAVIDVRRTTKTDNSRVDESQGKVIQRDITTMGHVAGRDVTTSKR
jgi:hypothetical protein